MRRILFVLVVAGLAALVPTIAASAEQSSSAPPTTVQKTPVAVTEKGDESAAPTVPEDTNVVGIQWSGDQDAKFRVEALGQNGKWNPQGVATAPDGGADADSAEARNAASRIHADFASEPLTVDDVSKVRIKVTEGDVSDVRIVAIGTPNGMAAPSTPNPLSSVNPLAAGGLAFAAAGAISTKKGRKGSLVIVLLLGMVGAAAVIGVPNADAARPGDVPFPGNPGYVSRAQWGADENLRRSVCPEGPDYANPRFVVVHHTASPNSYSPGQTAATVRGIYTYYIQGRGYCDIGYNFLIDRYGIIYEGRYGGVDRGVIGAHATNFNTGTTGVAMIGDHSNVSPTSATFNGLVRLLAWKMSVHQINPYLTYAHRGGIVNAIIGHRDAGRISGDGTACPGNAGYAILAPLLNAVRPLVAYGYPVGGVDVARRQPNAIQVKGWTADPDAARTPIQVHVYVDGRGVAIQTADQTRTDVANTYPSLGAEHGYDVTVPVSQTQHRVCVYGISIGNGANRELGCRTLSGNTTGHLDTSTRGPGTVRLTGWAIDPDTTAPLPIHVYVDTVGAAVGVANQNRPDVEAAMPGYGPNHGFDITLPVTGSHRVCAYGISTGGKGNVTLGCTLVSGAPRGVLDSATRPSGTLRVTGWAFDPDTTAPIAVHVYVDGRGLGVATADRSRPDVGSVYPAWGAAHGYDITLTGITAGRHQVCTYGIGVAGAGNSLLGCKTTL
jgi:hypothetical protein